MMSLTLTTVPTGTPSLQASYHRRILRPSNFTFTKPLNPICLTPLYKSPRIRASAPLLSPQICTHSPPSTPPTDSTRTVSTILSLTLSLSRLFPQLIQNLAVSMSAVVDFTAIQSFQQGSNMLNTIRPAFFATMQYRSMGSFNTPLTVVAAGLAKWLDIYSGVLMVRVLMSWFPNIPWDRQPLSAIRDLCDPYLNLFRNIIPPVFDTLDVSPLLAFAVLGTLSSLLNGPK